jgi:FAD/FMN-containing dehydrogenase
MGLCLKNQGDIDSQHIAGAMSTATHGSGIRQQCFSATARRFRVVLPSAEAIDVTEDNPELLAAMQVSLGLLGVITEVELKAREAFAIAERIEFWPLEEILARWDDEMSNRRHFSFFWMPAADSPDRLFMEYPDGLDMTDWARVKLYDELPASSLDDRGSAAGADRLDRPYRIYPDPDFQGEITMRELEYMVPFDRGKDAFLALRELVLAKYPDNKYPIEIRSIAADNAYLSPFYARDSISVSICGHKYLDYRGFLADVATTLDPFDPRPHWGKIHYMDRQRLQQAFPQYDRFTGIREHLDPAGTFLGPHLSPAFG